MRTATAGRLQTLQGDGVVWYVLVDQRGMSPLDTAHKAGMPPLCEPFPSISKPKPSTEV